MEKLSFRDHILLMSPKCHPELAGVGIENSWGKSALHFRQHNDCQAKHLMRNVLDSLSRSNLPRARVRKFARRTREYNDLYAAVAKGQVEANSHAKLEALRATKKKHRGALELDLHFIRDA